MFRKFFIQLSAHWWVSRIKLSSFLKTGLISAHFIVPGKHFNNMDVAVYILLHTHQDNTPVPKWANHDDVIKWNHFPRYWPFVQGINRSPVNSPHKGQWHGALTFSLICTRINGWVNNGEAGDLRRHCVHYDVTAMWWAVISSYGYRYHVTLCIGHLHPITVYKTGFWVCIVLVTSVIMCSF